MAEILINANDRRIQYTASGGQTVFAYDFPIYVNSHITVVRNRAGTLTTRVLTTDYTVSGVGAEAGGNVTLTAGATAGDVMTLYASTPYERTSDYGVGGDFAAATVNKDFDWQTMLAQQNNRDVSRALGLHIADASTPLRFDIATTASRQSKLLEVDATGTLVKATRSLASFDADVLAAAASAAAAASSASAAATSATAAGTSATAAATSATAAAASATAAASSASAAATSATNAATSATSAATQATAAASSATAAAASATTATTQATNAASSASSAATSATNAANSATSASTSATTATTQATNASNSATAAASSATAAAASASSAAASAAAAAISAASGLYQVVVAKTFADSPIVPAAADEGTLYLIDTSGGNVVVNLSSLATYGQDEKFAFAKMTADANTVTINRGGTDTINGTTSKIISNQYEVNIFVGDSATGAWITAAQAASLADGSVTFAKLQNIATDSLIGRDTAGTGVPENITVGGGIEFTGAGAIRTAAFTGDVTKTAGGTALTIAANAVTSAKFRQSVARSVVGITGNATADVADIQGTTDQVLRVNGAGTALAFGAIDISKAAAVSGILAAANGGNGNGFFAVSGPATSTKTFTFPNASATVLTDNALVTAAQGGTANGFFAVSGPASSTKTFTFPNASATVLTDNAAVTVAQGGTGRATSTTAYGVICAGTTATGALQTLAALGAAGTVLTSNGAGALPSFQTAGAANGTIIQSLTSYYTTNADLSTTIPQDDTIPQITEGTEVVTQAITPTSATSTILIIATWCGAGAAAQNISAAIFVDATANALRSGQSVGGSTLLPTSGIILYTESAASTSSRTYRLRIGMSSGTCRMNGTTSGRLHGGTQATSITVQEIKG